MFVFQVDALSNVALKHLIERCGAHLKHLNLSGNVLRGFQQVFNTLIVRIMYKHVFCPIVIVIQILLNVWRIRIKCVCVCVCVCVNINQIS